MQALQHLADTHQHQSSSPSVAGVSTASTLKPLDSGSDDSDYASTSESEDDAMSSEADADARSQEGEAGMEAATTSGDLHILEVSV